MAMRLLIGSVFVVTVWLTHLAQVPAPRPASSVHAARVEAGEGKGFDRIILSTDELDPWQRITPDGGEFIALSYWDVGLFALDGTTLLSSRRYPLADQRVSHPPGQSWFAVDSTLIPTGTYRLGMRFVGVRSPPLDQTVPAVYITGPWNVTPETVTRASPAGLLVLTGDGPIDLPPIATFTAQDTTTSGNWRGVFGTTGWALAGADTILPNAVQVAVVDQLTYFWPSITDSRALLRPGSTQTRIQVAWYQSDVFYIDVMVGGSVTRPVSIYMCDYDNANRQQRIDVVSSTGAVVDTRVVSNFTLGTYLTWNVRGAYRFRLTRVSGPNAVASAVFIQ